MATNHLKGEGLEINELGAKVICLEIASKYASNETELIELTNKLLELIRS